MVGQLASSLRSLTRRNDEAGVHQTAQLRRVWLCETQEAARCPGIATAQSDAEIRDMAFHRKYPSLALRVVAAGLTAYSRVAGAVAERRRVFAG